MTAAAAVVPHRPEIRNGLIRVAPHLSGVPETMLWPLYGRACESLRADGVLVDPDSVQICEAIDYDFEGHFGQPGGSLAARAAEIDLLLLRWLEIHPDGLIVSLGEGLETQARRVDNGRMRWPSVDLPASIELREQFLPPTGRFRHMAANALDPAWMASIAPSSGIFIVAQGLFMYLDPAAVRRLFVEIVKRFPTAEMAFDVIPRWFSLLTLWGIMQTPHYRLPPMPWGIDRNQIESSLRSWTQGIASVNVLDYWVPRGLPRIFEDLYRSIAIAHNQLPCLVHVVIGD